MTQTKYRYPIRVGIQLQPQHSTYEAYAEVVQKAEALDVDTIWDWDHFFPLYGNPDGNHFEGWTLLAAMAAMTSKAQVGCLVTCNTYRNPALLSNMAKTVDHISHGRLILGIGAGWFERDYKEYGYDFGTAGSRLAALEETLKIVRQRWEVDQPRPTRRIPILIGGGGEKVTLRLTATYADMWHGFGDPETIGHKMQVLDDWCVKVGRDPHAIERCCGTQKYASDEQRDALVRAGATHLILGMSYPWDVDAIEDLVRWRNKRRG